MSDIIIRKVNSLTDLRKVYRLVNDTYNKAGIANRSSDGLMIHHPEQDVVPESHIFIAEIGEKIVGTITFTIDNQFGLMIDDDFKEEMEIYRSIYPKISAVWRFAILPELQNDLRIMKKLIGVAALHMKWYNVPICFMTISPEHARIYKRIMNMEEVAIGKDSNKLIRKEHADVVLLKSNAGTLPEKWYAHMESEVMA